MDTKLILALIALGAIDPSIVKAQDMAGYEIEQLNIHPRTLEMLRYLTQFNAVHYDQDLGKVIIDSSRLPSDFVDGLRSSAEVTEDQDLGVFVMNDTFANVLAQQNSFGQMGTLPSLKAQQLLMERLKEKSTPVLRKDLELYARHNFW
ncbi:MAG: hypothetical protein H6621_00030 [Halobacteriovoraceae bacterium]|nr:hypothetical protein [Halobacteriovoraceae bacterium]